MISLNFFIYNFYLLCFSFFYSVWERKTIKMRKKKEREKMVRMRTEIRKGEAKD
jgi:hypothetical protein